MIVEFRTYRLKPGSVAEAEQRFGEALPNRAKVSPLSAFWHTEVGPLTRIIHVLPCAGHSELSGLNRGCHIWAYKDAADRFATREKARKEGIWPPRGGQPGQTLVQENMLVVPASFSPLS